MKHDLRYAARQLRLNPGFATIAIASLALGIGANTAIFQLLDTVRLRTLPVKDPQQLAIVRIANREHASGGFSSRYSDITNPQWEQIRDQQRAFSGIFAWSPETLNLARGGPARNANVLWVSGDAFRVLGVQPILGRTLTGADDRRGCGSPAAVISYGFWQSEFGGEVSALGRMLMLEGHPFEIIGVTPANFFGVEVGRTFDIAIPICADPIIRGEDSKLEKRNQWWLAVVARLKPGWSLDQATAQLRAISPGLFEATLPPTHTARDAQYFREYRLGAFPAQNGFSELRQDYSNPLWMLLGIASVVLLIACANLANLMLARASAREKEIAVRLALGASRMRLIRQLLAESLLLAITGASLGVFLAQALSRFLVSLLSTQSDPLFLNLVPDWRVLGFTSGLAILTCLLFGLTPALRATRGSPGAVMRASGRGLTSSRERFSLRRALVAGQVALSLVLLVGALLFVRSLTNLLTVSAGFQQDGILVMNLNTSPLKVPLERRRAFEEELIERVRSIPGVDAAATANIVPVSGSGWNQTIMIGQDRKGGSQLSRVTAGYFKTIGIPIIAGRDFNDRDAITAPKVAIVNETFAKKRLDGANPIGRTFRLEQGPGEPDPLYEIVGLVKDTKYYDLREDFPPIAYFPESQEDRPGQYAHVLIRSRTPILALTSAVKHTIAEVSPDISIDFRVFKTQIGESLLRERLMATLSGFFGMLAVLLATIGLYGVISYMVARRTNEIGIRMALGADRGGIVRLILREAAVLLSAGLAAGVVLALLAARTASAMLFGLKPHDPATIVMAAVSLAVVAVAASYLPARRAAKLDPMVALREE